MGLNGKNFKVVIINVKIINAENCNAKNINVKNFNVKNMRWGKKIKIISVEKWEILASKLIEVTNVETTF